MVSRFSLVVILAALAAPAAMGQTPADAKTRSAIYSVADLVAPIPGLDDDRTKDEWLVDLIMRHCSPGTWRQTGGEGSIVYYPHGMALDIRQTDAVQNQIVYFLGTLRQAQSVQVAVEMRVVSLDQAALPRLLKTMRPSKKEDVAKLRALLELLPKAAITSILSEKDVASLLTLAQGDRGVNILQAPKVTVFNGQQAVVRTEETQFKVRALVGVDLRQVQLEVAARLGELEVEKSTRLPEGNTLVLNARDKDQQVLLLVTPRLIFDVEEERLTPAAFAEPAPPKALPTKVAEQAAPEKGKLEKLLARYEKACAAGDHAKASRLALKALEIDPACFSRTSQNSSASVREWSSDPNEQGLREMKEEWNRLGFRDAPPQDIPATTNAANLMSQSVPLNMVQLNSAVTVGQHAHDTETPILPAFAKGQKSSCASEPDTAEVLRAMPQVQQSIPGVLQISRENIEVVTEKLADHVDPARFYPLVGPAQLHHCHWKCTVHYTERIDGMYPFPFQTARQRVEIVYIDKDHLHRYDAPHAEK